jgi:ribonucleotide reductase beta subunit family protein with ferritin-like domain
MCRHAHVTLLEPEKASEIYRRITGNDKKYSEKKTLAEIYSDTHDDFMKPKTQKKKNLGFGS